MARYSERNRIKWLKSGALGNIPHDPSIEKARQMPADRIVSVSGTCWLCSRWVARRYVYAKDIVSGSYWAVSCQVSGCAVSGVRLRSPWFPPSKEQSLGRSRRK